MNFVFFAADTVKLKELNRPDAIVADNEFLYITEDAGIYIYSQKNYQLIKRFGKRGEGPQEFIPARLGLLIYVRENDIFINSTGKLSCFSREGEFKGELRASGGKEFQPIGNSFIGWEFYQEGRTTFRGINIYDAELKKQREITRMVHSVQEGRGFKIFSARLILRTYNGKIYMCSGEGFVIDKYGATGQKEFSISQAYKRIRVTDGVKKNVLGFFRTDRRYKEDYEVIKKIIIFPEYFPVIRSFFVSNDKLYVRTYHQTDRKAEFFIFDLKGRLIKKIFLPIRAQNARVLFLSYPYTIHNNRIYELIDNVEREEWELHITEIE